MANLDELLKVGIGGATTQQFAEVKKDKYHRQYQLEQEMVTTGIEDFLRSTQSNTLNGRESITDHGQLLIKKNLEAVSKELQKQVDTKTIGRRMLSLKLLETIRDEGKETFDTAAFIILRTVMNNLTVSQLVQKVGIAIGHALEAEARNREFERIKPKYFQAVLDDVKRKQYKHKETVMTHSMNKMEIDWEPWSPSDKLHLGTHCITIVEQVTGLVHHVRRTTAKNETPIFLEAQPAVLKLIEDTNGKLCHMFPKFYPMVVPPQGWTGIYKGGYLTKDLEQAFIKTKTSNFLSDLKNRDDEMTPVFDAVNGIQNTKWRINKPVLQVLEAVWELGHVIGKLPSRYEDELPPKPFDTSDKEGFKVWKQDPDNREKWIDWKHKASKTYERNSKNTSKKIQVSALIELAKKFQQEDDIYFPHQLDFRGRAYPMPAFLEPQGAEFSRALLEFCDGKRMGDHPKSGYWLAIHTANMFGEDKLSLDDREQWTKDNSDKICQVASDPLSNMAYWRSADKPFSFLAACYEWNGYMKKGKDHYTHLPIAIDGSCNGLQIFSLMLRDEVGGEATNLTPRDKPQDIYKIVSDKTIAQLEQETSEDIMHHKYPIAKKELAKLWLDYGVNRKVCKRCVMIVPYSGTKRACRQYVEKYVQEQLDLGIPNPFGDKLMYASEYLADAIWKNIESTVIKAKEAMKWLKNISKLAAKMNIPINWKVCTGFWVQQHYQEVNHRRVETKLGDKIIKLTITEDKKKINKRRQAQGISANFVHSLDAAAMMLTVNKCRTKGITDFQMIHDSYGTHATNIETMGQCLREVFVEMFEENVLETFRDHIYGILSPNLQAKLTPIPEMGKLNIYDVKESKYFFA